MPTRALPRPAPLDVGRLGDDGRGDGDADPAPLTRAGLIGIGFGPGRLGLIGGSTTSDCTSLGFVRGGTGNNPFKYRGQGGTGTGDTPHSVQRVAGALDWLARHQRLPEGNWSFGKYVACCHDASGRAPAPPTRNRRHRNGPLAVPGQRPNPPEQRPLQKDGRGRRGLARSQSESRRRSPLRLDHVRPRPGHHHPVRSLWHERRSSIGYAAQRAVDFIQSAQNRRPAADA